MPRPRLRTLSVLPLLLAGCGEAPEPALAVGDVAFAEDELRGLSQGRLETLAALTAVGIAVARDEVGRLGGPLLERQRRERLIEKLADEIAVREAGVSDEVLEARYLADPEVELTVRHLVIRAERWEPEAARAAARARAESARARIRGGEPFAEVAAEVSEEPGADRTGGLLRPGREGTWVTPFWDAARRLPEGGMSGVVETEYGFHVLRLEEREVVPFQEHRDEVVRSVAGLLATREQREAFVDSIAGELAVHEDAARLWQAGEAPDSLRLASWPEDAGAEAGGLTVAGFERYRVSLPGVRGERIASAPLDDLLELVREAAREALFAGTARREGFRVTPRDEERIVQEWNERVSRWAAVLRFAPGLDAEAIRERAMSGLDATGQEVRIAREEIQRLSPLLRSAYPVVTRDRPAAGRRIERPSLAAGDEGAVLAEAMATAIHGDGAR